MKTSTLSCYDGNFIWNMWKLFRVKDCDGSKNSLKFITFQMKIFNSLEMWQNILLVDNATSEKVFMTQIVVIKNFYFSLTYFEEKNLFTSFLWLVMEMFLSFLIFPKHSVEHLRAFECGDVMRNFLWIIKEIKEILIDEFNVRYSSDEFSASEKLNKFE